MTINTTMSTPLTPEVRAELLDHMTRACVLWAEDLMSSYFTDPKSSGAQQLLLEAYTAAITTVASKLPNRLAMLQTFTHEIQDFINKETK